MSIASFQTLTCLIVFAFADSTLGFSFPRPRVYEGLRLSSGCMVRESRGDNTHSFFKVRSQRTFLIVLTAAVVNGHL